MQSYGLNYYSAILIYYDFIANFISVDELTSKQVDELVVVFFANANFSIFHEYFFLI